MPWKTVPRERPPDQPAAEVEELPYPPPITPDRSGKAKPKPKPASKPKR